MYLNSLQILTWLSGYAARFAEQKKTTSTADWFFGCQILLQSDVIVERAGGRNYVISWFYFSCLISSYVKCDP